MSDLGFDFVPGDVEEMRDFEPLPAGKYLAIVSKSEMKDTKAGDGKYLALTFQVVDGQFKNRLVWHNLNLVNQSEVAVNIARSELKAMCDALGITALRDSNELHDKPMVISLKVGQFNGNPNNEVKKFERCAAAPLHVPQSTPAVQPAAAAGGKPSWMP